MYSRLDLWVLLRDDCTERSKPPCSVAQFVSSKRVAS